MTKEVTPPTELDTFLPEDGTTVSNGATKYKVTKSGDLEAANVAGEFDPFKARQLEHPVSDGDTLVHLLKSCLGTGILSMPEAFRNSGLVLGVFSTIIVSLICTHCAYILVVCAHELYRRSGKTAMSFADVASEACIRGPKWSRRFAPYARQTILIGIFITYFGTCSAYTVIVAKNFIQVLAHYLGYEINVRIFILILLVPLLLLAWVPNLKNLTPVSMIANIFMALGLLITLYYLVIDLPPISERRLVSPIQDFPIFFSITIFAIEAIGVIMPLENNMEKPTHFVGICGVLNQGMSGVTLGYILIGFMGYFKYGDLTEGAITLNLPQGDYAAQTVKVLIALAVLCTFGIQFYICLEIVWNGVKEKFTSRPVLANYVIRTVMAVISALIAIAIPTITPFVGLIGAFCFSILGLMSPVFIEVITFWDQGFGKFNWKIWKNAIIIFAGFFALIFGSKSSIEEILKLYIDSGVVNGTSVFNGTAEIVNATLNGAINSTIGL